MEKTNQNNIDKKVQEAMENFQVPFNPDHWTQMEQRLIQLDADEKAFDESVQGKLAASEMAYKASHWDLMNQRLEEDLDKENNDFDSSIRHIFNNSETPFNASHWDLMNEKLNEEFSWKGKILRYKVLEAALMILLLFTVINVLDTEADKNINFNELEKNKIENAKEEKSFKNQGTEWRKRTPVGKNQGKKVQNSTPTPANNPPIVFNTTDDKNIEQNSTQKDLYTEGGANLEKSGALAVKSSNTVEDFENGSSRGYNRKNTIVEILPTLQAHSIAFDELKSDLNSLNETLDTKTAIAAVEPVEVLRTKALSISALYDEPQVPQPAKKTKWWRLGIFGTANTDMADISFKYKGVEGKGSDWSINKGLGISLGFKKKKLEVSTGLAYSQKRYQTQLPSEVIRGSIITGTPERSILPKSVELDMVQVPLNISYAALESGRWSIYGTIGGSVNMAMKMAANYYDLPSGFSGIDLRNIQETDLPKYGTPFKVGTVKNHNNFYYSAHIGAGVDYKITPKVSIYMQPNFEKHIGNSGIGSRNDRINTLSLYAGLKMSFGKS